MKKIILAISFVSALSILSSNAFSSSEIEDHLEESDVVLQLGRKCPVFTLKSNIMKAIIKDAQIGYSQFYATINGEKNWHVHYSQVATDDSSGRTTEYRAHHFPSGFFNNDEGSELSRKYNIPTLLDWAHEELSEKNNEGYKSAIRGYSDTCSYIIKSPRFYGQYTLHIDIIPPKPAQWHN